MVNQKAYKIIDSLIDKAGQAHSAQEALQFANAALVIARSIEALHYMTLPQGQDEIPL
jgi:hypothetical protein